MDAQVPLPASRGRKDPARGVSFPPAWLRGYPWWPLPDALRLLRIVTALLFMAHASMRFVYGSIPQFGAAMENLYGFPHGELWVLAITFYELGAGTLLLLDRGVRWAASGLAVIVSVGIYLIHRHLGWFVGEHGTGGSEYSVALLAMLLVIAANDAARASHPTLHAGESDPA
ncbi:MAG: DoxX family protein [Thermomonas sp.]